MRNQNEKFIFHVMDGGDSSVGIPSSYEKISIDVEYGFYDEYLKGEFVKGMKEFLHDFYAECRCEVMTDEEFKEYEKDGIK